MTRLHEVLASRELLRAWRAVRAANRAAGRTGPSAAGQDPDLARVRQAAACAYLALRAPLVPQKAARAPADALCLQAARAMRCAAFYLATGCAAPNRSCSRSCTRAAPDRRRRRAALPPPSHTPRARRNGQRRNRMTTAKILEFFITTRCTLRCRECLCAVPFLPNPHDTPKQDLLRHFALAFPLYDRIGRVEIIGGEPLLHPDLAGILTGLLPYRSKFSKIRVTTNGTLLPSPAVIDAAHRAQEAGLDFDFLVDDYGPLSRKLPEIRELLAREGIDCRVDHYTGDCQRGGGWLAIRRLHAARARDGGPALAQIFALPLPAPAVSRHARRRDLQLRLRHDGHAARQFQLSKNEYVNLNDPLTSVEEKQRVLRTFLTHPTTACRYCDGFCEDSPRFPGGRTAPEGGDAMLTLRRLAVIPTLRCTLRCRLCATACRSTTTRPCSRRRKSPPTSTRPSRSRTASSGSSLWAGKSSSTASWPTSSRARPPTAASLTASSS